MYLMDYDSVKVTNYVQRFCIIPRISNGVAEFTLLVQLVNNERTEVYDDTYEDPRDLLHDLRNGWYLSRVKHPEQVKCGQICEVVVGHLKTPLVCSSQLTRSVYTR